MMKNKPVLISVAVPLYNAAHSAEGFHSLLMQDYPEIEVVVVDDGSAEDTTETIRAQLETGHFRRIVVERFPENRGTVAAINRAWSLCEGEIIFTLAADDCFYDSHVLSDWTRHMLETKCDLSVGYRAVMDETLTVFRELSPSPRQEKYFSGEKRLWNALARENFIFGAAEARTAESLRRWGYVPEDYRLVEDYPMNLCLLRQGAKLELFDRIVIRYRIGGISTPARMNPAYLHDLETITRLEILPYVRCAGAAQSRQRVMLLKRERTRRYQLMRQKGSGALWNLLCHLRYPEHFLYRLRTALEKPARRRQEARLMKP